MLAQPNNLRDGVHGMCHLPGDLEQALATNGLFAPGGFGCGAAVLVKNGGR